MERAVFVRDEHHILVISDDHGLRGQLAGYLQSQPDSGYRVHTASSLAMFLEEVPGVTLDAALIAGNVFIESEVLNWRSRQQEAFPVILVREAQALHRNRMVQRNTSFTQILPLEELSPTLVLTTVKYLVEFKLVIAEMKNLQQVVEIAEQRNHRLFQYVSHELTAPLQMARLLQESISELDDMGEIKACVNTSLVALTHALDTINNISEYVRSNRKMLQVRNEEFNVVTVLEELQDLFAMQAAHKGIDLEIDYFSYEDCKVTSDKARIRQVLINLVRNAINYTDQGSVTVWAQRGEDNLCISVTDTGVGMSEEHLQKILTRKTYEPSSGFEGGLGIGLKLSREIMELVGGYLSVHSVEGKGTTFTIVLPDEQEAVAHSTSTIAKAG